MRVFNSSFSNRDSFVTSGLSDFPGEISVRISHVLGIGYDDVFDIVYNGTVSKKREARLLPSDLRMLTDFRQWLQSVETLKEDAAYVHVIVNLNSDDRLAFVNDYSFR